MAVSNHSRHRKYEHLYRAPEEEEDLAHIHMTLRFVLIVFGMVPVSLYLIAIWVAAHPHLTEIDMDPNFTAFVKSTYQYNETGNGEIWVYEDDGTKKNLGKTWNPFYVMNMSHYTFGSGNNSFCQERNETFEQAWSTSLFRASQLYSSVQTGMRYGLLFVMLPMILNAYIIAKTMFMEQKTIASLLIGTSYFCNEVIFYIASFMLLALHAVFDEKYIPYNTIYFSIVMFLSATKLLLRNFTEPLGLPTILRSVGASIFIVAHSPLEHDIQDYVDNIYCDTFAPPNVCVLQLMCILTLFLTNLYDVHQSRFFKVVVSPTADEVSIQKHPQKSVFLRYKVPSAY